MKPSEPVGCPSVTIREAVLTSLKTSGSSSA